MSAVDALDDLTCQDEHVFGDDGFPHTCNREPDHCSYSPHRCECSAFWSDGEDDE